MQSPTRSSTKYIVTDEGHLLDFSGGLLGVRGGRGGVALVGAPSAGRGPAPPLATVPALPPHPARTTLPILPSTGTASLAIPNE